MDVSKEKKEGAKSEKFSIQRQMWVGAAIGLYFGWFFRPAREPSLFVVLFLSILITVLLTGWQLFRRRKMGKTAAQIWRKVPLLFIQYAAFLAILEARHFAYDFGGRLAVIVMTTIMGALSGLWIAYQSKAK